MTTVNPIIETRGLTKNYGHVAALRGLDLTVGSGEVHGFLGPNGAGKSTTLRILLGLVRSSGGTARVLNKDPWSDSVALHKEIAYVPGDVSLWPGLTGGETIDLLTHLRGGADRRLLRSLTDDFQFDPRTRARSYSKGNRQKVALIAALARPADLYLFDEPTSGLDPVMESVFRNQVQRIKAEGGTILLSSHILSEVEQLCDIVTIIRAGTTVESGTLDGMRHLSRTSYDVRGPGVGTALAAALGQRGGEGIHNLVTTDDAAEFDVDVERVPEVLTALSRLPVTGLTVSPPSLESIFLRHYGAEGEAGGGAAGEVAGDAGGHAGRTQGAARDGSSDPSEREVAR
ncbi:MAG: ABC transporter ATP-binding protein [Glaciihabitans sp.]